LKSVMCRPLLASLLALAISPAAAQAQDQLIAQVPQPVRLSALGGTLAYSRADDAGAWHLVLWANGIARDAPVAAATGPFDVDLGRGPGGHLLAAYTRCGSAAHSCDLYALDTVSGAERRLAASAKGADERGPAIWATKVVYASRGALWIGNTSGAPQRRRVRDRAPSAWDFQAGRIVIRTKRARFGREGRELTVRLLGGRRLVHAASGALSTADITRPQFAGSEVFVAKVRRAAAGQRFVRVDYRTGADREVVGRLNVLAAALVGDRVAYLQTAVDDASDCEDSRQTPAPCPIRLTPPLDFK
jgi:hypothetical protein